MVLGGVNFALMYRAIVRRQPRAAARDQELRLYLALLALGSIVVVDRDLDRGRARGRACGPRTASSRPSRR